MLFTMVYFLIQILEEDVKAYEKVVEELRQESGRLIADGHFDCTNITARQVRMYVYANFYV